MLVEPGFSDSRIKKSMPSGFPVSPYKSPAIQSTRQNWWSVVAVLLITFCGVSPVRAQAIDISGGKGAPGVGVVSQSLQDGLAPAPDQALLFGTDCTSTDAPPVIPAALAGPVAGLMPQRPTACDSLDAAQSESASHQTKTAGRSFSAVSICIPDAVILLRQWPWQTQSQLTTGGATPATRAVADVARSDYANLDTPASTPRTSTCIPDDDCAPQEASDAQFTGLAPLPVATSVDVLAIARYVMWGLLLLTLLGVIGLAGWFAVRWFEYDRALVRAARAGLRRGEFYLEYQPILAARRAVCVGVEVLLRWDNATYAALGPAHFMPVIEGSNVIGPLTRFVMSRAAEELRQIGVPRSLYLGVNVSASHLTNPAFVADLTRVTSQDSQPLILELPAQGLAEFGPRLAQVMAEARTKGVRFALSGVGPDDHGVCLPPDLHFEMVKVGREVLALPLDERATAVELLTEMAHALGAVVVVEGVETAGHHEIVRASKAEFGQGFFYSRALRVGRLADLLESSRSSASQTQAGAATVLGWRVKNHS
jgi:c-di-GMP phosphodiesterase